ncbi:hypothetical protein RBB50_002421 [Rhinocladiella similis]
MPDPKTAVSFDAIIQADRQRKKNAALANEIFGRNKQTRGDSRSSSKASTRTPDLASRITKASSQRSSSAASTGSARNTPSRPSSTTPQQARALRLASALETQQANIVTPPRRTTKGQGPGLSIKGKAGPFTVEASNFAPGTTAADIESALQGETIDDNGASGMLSCRIIATAPAVVAEMIFTERHLADRVISTYNNQRADGRILHLYLKQSGSGPTPLPSGNASNNTNTLPDVVASNQPSDNGMEDIEMESEVPFAQDDRDRERDRERDRRPATKSDTDSRDGRRDDNYDDRRDDDRRDRDRDRERERERERDRDRERERERDRDRERDQRYDTRRHDRGPPPSSSYRDSNNSNSTNAYNSRPSHYGNGVGGPGRGMYGGGPPPAMYHRGGGGGGRMYHGDGRGGMGGRGGFGSGPGSGYRRGY